MKLIFFIGLSCFCFNLVILTSTDEIKSENISEEIFKSNELCSPMDSKTQLMDLNVDCQLLVLEQLDFVSLMSLAETNNRFKSLVSMFLERMFRKKVVDMDLKIPSYTWPFTIEIVGDYIKIKNFTIAEQVLKNFGHLIQKLQIRRAYPKTVESYRSIYKLVNLYCSKTLKEITLEKSVNHFLEEFTNQFENVEEVFIENALETDRRLNEIFPSVRRLHFYTFEISNTDSINVNYTNLEHLKIFMNVIEGPLTEILAVELIKKNSHIRSLALESASIELIKIAADSLPQLERLKLEEIQCEDSNKSISFANVKILEIERCVDCLFLIVKFGNVDELYIDDLAESMFDETGFLASNKMLKKLQLVSEYVYLENDLFKQLSNTNSTLQDIFISNASSVEVETILQLIENSKQLEKLQIIFSFDDGCESTSEALSSKISDEWSMETFSNTMILKKKQNLN